MSTVKLADYLFTRLKQLGVGSIHGVPGDYNLTLLDYVEPNGIKWIGNCNELNAGYATDGYSRLKGIGALITTFGVGELSAINAIAGAYTELAPVVHIVGTPSRTLQNSRALVHHTFNDGDYQRFALMHEHVTVAQASLRDPRTCPQLIDSVLMECLIHSRPVYIQVPADMVDAQVASDGLKTKLSVPEPVPSKDEEAALKYVLERVHGSRSSMILVDGEVRGYGIVDQVEQFCRLSAWPTYTSVFGKGLLDESMSNYYGIWKGSSATQEEQDFVKGCDLVLCFGPHLSTTNSYFGSARPNPETTIFIKQTSVEAQGQVFQDLPAKYFMAQLLEKLDKSKVAGSEKPMGRAVNGHAENSSQSQVDGALTQQDFYHKFTNVLRSGDMILAETGTAGAGAREFQLPRYARLFSPATWLSIGYMLPAAQGAAVAQRELHREGKWQMEQASSETQPRTVLLIGDGSFQMTVQELGTIIRENLNVLVVLINNDGYTIERCIHGWDKAYNDIGRWNYLQAPSFFGAKDAKTTSIRTWGQLEKAIRDEEESGNTGLRMWEVFMDVMDAPLVLAGLPGYQEAQKAKSR